MKRNRRSLKYTLAMLTLEQAATELSVMPRLLCRPVKAGKLPCRRLGRCGEKTVVIRYELHSYARRNRWELWWLRLISRCHQIVMKPGLCD